ncbi:penicillin-binding protein [Deltaproteobacteria bacterium Smac51]|nr:penicillin-binding protein [Deltaproteobacteria bacterium Smac51]
MSIGRDKWMKVKLCLVGAAFVVAFAGVMYKAFTLQVVDQPMLVEKARQEVERHLNLGAVRGEIFDAGGERLAASVAVPSLYIDASVMKDKSGAARLLSEAVEGLDFETVAEKIESGRKFVWLKRRISSEEAEAVRNLNLPGVGLSKEYRRTYPNGGMAAHLLGFVGVDGQGLEGLELAMDDQLRAKQERLKVKRDNLGRIMVDNVNGELEQSQGASIVLTLDRRIQYITEKALSNAVETYGAKSGMALVMRPKTGAVVAAAVWPNFDPNDYQSAPNASRRNRILTDTFEPGSTFKVFVVAAALEENVVNPETVIYCENGAFRVASHTVRDTSSHGDLTLSQVIKHSSNIGSLKVGAILGNDLLYNYLTRFSFGEKTGLNHLPGEAGGVLRQPKQWHQVDAANIAFGQGLSVTTLQMTMAMCALANDGILMRPYIVDRVLDDEGRIIQKHEPQIIRQVVSPLTARQVSAMLRMAVQKGGTATRAEVAGYPVAGKTGTAQKVVRGGKTYAAGKYVASFLGFAPYHDPQLCVMVVLDEPQNGYYGGTVATPAFKEIVENSLPLLDIPPTEGKGDPVWPLLQKNSGGAPGVVAANQPTNFIRVKLKKGDRGAKGPITFEAAPSTDGEMTLEHLEPIFAARPSGPVLNPGVMPDLSGLTMREVVEAMSEYSMELEYLGSGHVAGQNPSPGTAVASGQSGWIVFERQ